MEHSEKTYQRRVLGLDVGGRRIGVAISDSNGSFAIPHSTIKAEPRAQAFAQIADLMRQYDVAEIVVGLPLTLHGEIGPQAKWIQTFATELETALEQKVHLYDERLTSVAAEHMMRNLGLKAGKRKAHIDEIAASIILQDYLDFTRNQHPDDKK